MRDILDSDLGTASHHSIMRGWTYSRGLLKCWYLTISRQRLKINPAKTKAAPTLSRLSRPIHLGIGDPAGPDLIWRKSHSPPTARQYFIAGLTPMPPTCQASRHPTAQERTAAGSPTWWLRGSTRRARAWQREHLPVRWPRRARRGTITGVCLICVEVLITWVRTFF